MSEPARTPSSETSAEAPPARVPADVHAVLLGAIAAIAVALPPLRGAGSLPLVLGSAVYLVLVVAIPGLRRSAEWLRAGELGASVLLATAGVAALSSVVLVVWARVTNPDLSAPRALVPDLGPPGLVLLGALCAVLNAGAEELVFRGVLLQLFESELGRGTRALVLQAALFGVLHYTNGFPRGVSGAFLTAVFGLLMGLLRRRARGLAAPWICHAICDATIAAVVFVPRL